MGVFYCPSKSVKVYYAEKSTRCLIQNILLIVVALYIVLRRFFQTETDPKLTLIYSDSLSG